MSNNDTSTQRNTARAKFRRVLLYQGMFARVAGQLGLTRTHVYYVAIGQRQSERVEKALLSEISRIDRRCA